MLVFRSLVRRLALTLSFRSARLARLLLTGLSAAGGAPQTIPLASSRPEGRLSPRVRKLPGGMTLKEKNGQMTQRDSATINTTDRPADAVVLALGEKPYAKGLGNPHDLSLPADQLQSVRAVRRLRHFEKLPLEPGQSRELTFDIDPRQYLGYPQETNQLQLEDGFFTLRIGTQQARFRCQGRPAGLAAPTPSLR
ncbi:MAG: fibronectin type III-like domain-contianing protein [Janthinobacterium lividum]